MGEAPQRGQARVIRGIRFFPELPRTRHAGENQKQLQVFARSQHHQRSRAQGNPQEQPLENSEPSDHSRKVPVGPTNSACSESGKSWIMPTLWGLMCELRLVGFEISLYWSHNR